MIPFKKIILFGFILSLNTAFVSAKTARWFVKPHYDRIATYSQWTYKYRQNGKVGLLDANGNPILAIQADSITDISNGYAVALQVVNSKLQISGIISETGLYTPVSDTYFANRYTLFSDGLVCVSDRNGKMGYLDVNGMLAVKCQFVAAMPFSEGWAAVQLTYNNVIYIDKDYDINHRPLYVSYHGGTINFGTTFKNGRALVAYSNKYAYIDTAGRDLGRYKHKGKYRPSLNPNGSLRESTDYVPQSGTSDSADWGYSLFRENGLLGYRFNGQPMLPAQFSSAQLFYNGLAKVTYRGHVGILQIIDEDAQASLDRDEIEMTAGGAIGDYYLNMTIPEAFQPTHITTRIDGGKGSYENIEATQISATAYRSAFTPAPLANQEQCSIRYEVYADELCILRNAQRVNVTHPAVVSLTGPYIRPERANEKDEQVVYANITNNSTHAVSVSITLSSPSQANPAPSNVHRTVTIAAGERYTISITHQSVMEKETVLATVSATVSGGETVRRSSRVTLSPFYD